MRSEVMVITPEMARQWLSGQNKNRKLMASHVTYLANEIKSGRWRISGDTIKFGDNGKLLDGQHRLSAILKAGIAIKSLVVFDIPVEHFTIIDRGVVRNIGDITGISLDYVDIYTFLIKANMMPGKKIKPSPDDVAKLHEYLKPHVSTLLKYCPQNVRYYSSSAMRTAVVLSLINNENDSEYILSTYKALVLRQYKNTSVVADALRKMHENETALKGFSQTEFKNRLETFYRGMYVFNKANANSLRVLITESLRVKFSSKLHQIVSEILEPNSNSDFKEMILTQKVKEQESQIRDLQNKNLKRKADSIDLELSKLAYESI
jgi:hypothetical protein